MNTPSLRFRVPTLFGIAYAVIDLLRAVTHLFFPLMYYGPLLTAVACLGSILLFLGGVGTLRRRVWAPRVYLLGVLLSVVQMALTFQGVLARGPSPSPVRVAVVGSLLVGFAGLLVRDAWTARNEYSGVN